MPKTLSGSARRIDGQFDYSALPAELADEARAVANRVRAAHQNTIRAIIDMGRDLLSIKERLGHGRFTAWLEAEFGGVARTAQLYMRAATVFGDKTETISLLPPAAVYRLAAPSTPAPVREEIVERLERGDQLGPSEIVQLIGVGRRARCGKVRQAQSANGQPGRLVQGDQQLLPSAFKDEFEHGEGEHEGADLLEKQREAARQAADLVLELAGSRLRELEVLLTNADLNEFRNMIIQAARRDPAVGSERVEEASDELRADAQSADHEGGTAATATRSTLSSLTEPLADRVEDATSGRGGRELATLSPQHRRLVDEMGEIPSNLRRSPREQPVLDGGPR